MEGMLLLSVEGLGELSPASPSDDIWESLGAKQDRVALLSGDGPCQHDLDGMQESQASEEYVREVEWRKRGHLETRRNNPCDPAAAAWLVSENSSETEVVYHLM
jgi:hypothetical protein